MKQINELEEKKVCVVFHYLSMKPAVEWGCDVQNKSISQLIRGYFI